MILPFRLILKSLVAAVCTLMCTSSAHAQQRTSELAAASELPDAPNSQAAISGTVSDSSGAVVVGADITLEGATVANNRVVQSNSVGCFRFAVVDPGTYKIAVRAKGFSPWLSAPILVHVGEKYDLSSIVLQVATTNSSVDVSISQHEIAEEQIKDEEKQRLFGIVPAFHFSFVWNAAPLSTGQKFKLAWKSATDPTAFIFTGATATYEQARNNLRVYGQGVEGFSKRYGVNYADTFDSQMISSAILPTLLHQDPRYFVKGKGSFQSRALHAMAFPFVARGDGGHAQPNFSAVLGSFASTEISNLYYPSSSQSRFTVGNVALELGLDSVGSLLLEFVYPQLMTSAPKHLSPTVQLILREGTPISLIVTEDQSAEDMQQGKPATFALLSNIKVGGVVVAKAGSKALGEAIGAAKLEGNGKQAEMPMQHLALQVGNEQVPLRGSKIVTGDDMIHYRPRNTAPTVGKTASPVAGTIPLQAGDILTLYVAADISLHSAQ